MAVQSERGKFCYYFFCFPAAEPLFLSHVFGGSFHWEWEILD